MSQTRLSLYERYEVSFKYLLEGGVELMFDTFIEFPLDLFKNITYIGMLLGVGLALMVFRDILFELLPGAIQYSDILAVWVDMTKTVLTIILDAVITAINALEDIVDTFTGHKSSFMHYLGISVINAATLKSWLNLIYTTCGDGNPYDIMGGVIQHATHTPVCSFARYLYPVKWLYEPISTIGTGLSLYRGSAVPDVSLYAPNDVNCKKVPPHVVLSVTCFAFNFGEFLVVVIVPITLLFFYLYDCRNSLSKLILGFWSLSISVLLTVDKLLNLSVKNLENLVK